MTLSRRRLLRAGLAGGAALAATGFAPVGDLLGGGVRGLAATPTSVARVRLDDAFRPLVGAFDTTEHVHDGWVDVMLWPGDRARLRATGATFELTVEDWHRSFLEERRREQRLADRISSARLGSRLHAPGHEQRTTYRLYRDYLDEMDAAVAAHPGIARRFTLHPTSWEGRPLQGVLVGADVASAATDGRPGAIMCGVHHAREWPSGEFTLNFLHDLLHGHEAGDELGELVEQLAIWIIPVANPDGFVRSREWLPVAEASLVWSTGADTALIAAEDGPGKRRNLRDNGSGTEALIGTDIGVDTNRNYPLMWGGVGASDQTSSATYHGPTPGSEPEVEALLKLMRRHQLIAGISNHTSGDLMLRPWGYTPDDTPDEALLTDLGARMADPISYTNGSWNEALYPGTGIWDDWLYGVQGTLAYTMEHFTTEATGNATPFHPVYAAFVVDKYRSVRPSYVEMLRAALDPATHLVLRGEAPAGTVLRLRKDVVMGLSRTDPDTGEQTARERVRSTCVVGRSGEFTWHVNPSASRHRQQEGLPAEEEYVVTATLPSGEVRRAVVTGERGETADLDLRAGRPGRSRGRAGRGIGLDRR